MIEVIFQRGFTWYKKVNKETNMKVCCENMINTYSVISTRLFVINIVIPIYVEYEIVDAIKAV